MGEGMVKTLRALCPSAVREGWAEHLINRFYRARAQSVMVGDMKAEQATEAKPPGLTKQYLEKFKRYSAVDGASLAFHEAELISILVYQTPTSRFVFGVVESSNKKLRYREVDLDENTGWDDPCGFTYYRAILSEKWQEFRVTNDMTLPNLEFHSYSYMIPWRGGGVASIVTKYAIMSEEWQQYHCGSFHVLK